jgi:ABC-type multidrug transport system ATPase subunit
MDKVMEINGLRKNYRTFTLDGVSLEIPKGTILGLIGPNGSGKTTTIRMLMNMARLLYEQEGLVDGEIRLAVLREVGPEDVQQADRRV